MLKKTSWLPVKVTVSEAGTMPPVGPVVSAALGAVWSWAAPAGMTGLTT
ncbi:hypothetical protein [Bradyrhizobium sp. AZCC 2230]